MNNNNNIKIEDFRIVSMRLYNEKYAIAKFDKNKKLIKDNSNIWKNIKDKIKDCKDKSGNSLSYEQKIDKLINQGVIVDYD